MLSVLQNLLATSTGQVKPWQHEWTIW